MSDASYERQHLATLAAGFINAAGTTRVEFGCQMTRIAAGHYGLILDADNTLSDIDETFIKATPKAQAARYVSVNDASASLTTIHVSSTTASAVDTGIEVALYRSVLPNL